MLSLAKTQSGQRRFPGLLVFLLLLLSSWSCIKRDTLPIHRGQLDLSLWDPRLRPVLELAGEWEFAFNTVLLPNQKIAEPAFIHWPKTWTSANQGYASYRLRLKLPRALHNQTLALFIPFQSTAMRVLLNGEKIFDSGSFGTDANTSRPSRDQAIVNFQAVEDVEILVHISNYHHSRGGTWYTMKMGLFLDVVDDRFRRLIMDAFITFMLLGLGLYFVFSYIVNRKPLSLAIGFTGLTNALRFSMTSSRLFEELIPLGFSAGFRLEYWSLYLLVQAYVIFAYLYLRTIFSRRIGLFLLICSLLVNAKVFLSVEFFSRYLYLAHTLCLFAILYCFYISVKGLRKNIWGSVFIFYGSLTIFTASLIDIILVNIFGNFDFYVIQYGSLAFLYMQAMAAGSRELIYLQKLQEEEEMRNHSYAQLGKIVYPHQMKMIQGGKILEETMPTSDSEAVVISFDIIGSSRIQHEKVKKFLRDTFSRCTQVMMEGYDPDKLQAPAYRIKEVGDGFLCSVGYPFRTISGSKANDALRLAYRFHEILKEEARVLQSEAPTCCGIGLALDSISGFYPESGAKEYDVFGRSVILATRYEAMRKYILDEDRESSIIILQSRVYDSLDRELRDGFNRFDLVQHKISVRDDSGATVLYYKLMA